MGTIKAQGSSISSTNSRKAATAQVNLFLKEQQRNSEFEDWPTDMEHLTYEEANDIGLYERFAYFMAHDSVSKKGSKFKVDAMINYVREFGQLMYTKHHDGARPSNLSSVGPGQGRSFISRITDNMDRLVCELAFETGDTEVRARRH